MTSSESNRRIEWIQNIPPDWHVRLLKRDFEVKLGKMLQSSPENDDDTEEYYLRSANVAWEGIDLSDVKRMWFSIEEKSSIRLMKNDLLVCEGGDVGRSCVWNDELNECYIQNAINRVRPTNDSSTRFLYFWMFLLKHQGFIDAIVSRITIAHLTTEKLKRIPVVFPPAEEQARIARYLDKSCTAIDQVVYIKRQQLQKLDQLRKSIIYKAVTNGLDDSVEVRDSRLDWCATIPVHWTTLKLKRVFAKVDYGISESTTGAGVYAVLKMGNIVDREIAFTKIEYVSDVPSSLILESFDLLFNRTNSHDKVAKVAIFRGRSEDNITFASYLVRLRTGCNHDAEYMNYLLNTDEFLGLARKLAIPSVQQANLNPTRYGRIRICIPPYDEQVEIRNFLDRKLAKTESVENKTKHQIEVLLEYKKSLIHECVTGKRRITEADLEQAA